MTFEILEPGEYMTVTVGDGDIWTLYRKYGNIPPAYIPVVQTGDFLLENPPPGYKRPVIVVERVARMAS
jgi:hypothetical protein